MGSYEDSRDVSWKNIKTLLKATGQKDRANELDKEQLDELEQKKNTALRLNQSLLNDSSHSSGLKKEFFERSAESQSKNAIDYATKKRKIREESEED